jgi:hypothetical protein
MIYNFIRVDSNCTTATYTAFCRNYGDHSTKAVGSHNWNEESIESMTRDLVGPWGNFRLAVQERNERTTASIEDLIDWAIQYLGELTETKLIF